MNNLQTKSAELEDRLIAFSVELVSFARKYEGDKVLQPIFNQLIRSGSSVGANYFEANNASSKADFRNKIFIAKKESAETRYWLRILKNSMHEKTEIERLLDECGQFLFIFQSIITTMKNGK